MGYGIGQWKGMNMGTKYQTVFLLNWGQSGGRHGERENKCTNPKVLYTL